MATHLKPRVMRANVCSRCASQQVATRRYNDTVEFKGLTLDVEGLQEQRCGNCGLRWTTQAQDLDNLALLRVAFAAERDAVRQRDGLLTGERIQAILRELALNRSQAAEVFGGGPNAFARYINGEVLQSFAMDRLLRVAEAFGPAVVQVLRAVNARADPAAPIAPIALTVTLSEAGLLPGLTMMATKGEDPPAAAVDVPAYTTSGHHGKVIEVPRWKRA